MELFFRNVERGPSHSDVVVADLGLLRIFSLKWLIFLLRSAFIMVLLEFYKVSEVLLTKLKFVLLIIERIRHEVLIRCWKFLRLLTQIGMSA